MSEWTTYGGSPLRQSADTTDPPVQGSPSRRWTSGALDGPVYGEPIIDGGSVYVATENDTVYALAAASGAVEWSDHLGTPVPASALPCGDITPTVGITSTMVVDPATHLLFAAAAVWNGSAVAHELVAINTSSHSVVSTTVLDRPGWSAAAELQRAGLALDGGDVLVAFGGNYGDCGDYHGWVESVPESGGNVTAYRVPTAREGAIWGPSGPAVDDAGHVFVATGNGSAAVGQPFDHGNAVIELSAALAEQQLFAPSNWAQDNESDADLGSTNPVLLPGGLVFIVGKEQTAFLLRAAALGGVGASVPSVGVCNSRGASAFAAGDLYVVCPDDGSIVSVAVGADSLSRRWTWHSPSGGASSPTVARGLVWSIDPDAAVLYGIDPATGSTRFTLPLDTGTAEHFAAPAAGEALVVVAGSRAVEAFG